MLCNVFITEVSSTPENIRLPVVSRRSRKVNNCLRLNLNIFYFKYLIFIIQVPVDNLKYS